MDQVDYYKLEEGKQIYYINNILIGEKHNLVQWLVNKRGISASKAHRFVEKLKEYKEKKHG